MSKYDTNLFMNIKLLDKILGHVLAAYDPNLVVLFGSYANRSENMQSDIDLVIVCPTIFKRRMLERTIKSNIKRYSLKADILVHSADEFKEATDKPKSFLGAILKQGVILYKKC